MKEPLKISDHFQSPGGFLLLILFVRIVLSARFSVVSRAPTTELYVVFWDVPIHSFREAPQSKVLVLLIVLPRDARVDPRSLFAYRMMRGQQETSTNQVGRRRGSSQELPTASSLMASMFVEELRSFCGVPDNISLELSDGPTSSTIGQVDNAIYFTLEQFAAGLRFPVSSLVKQFLHITRAPPALIHPNVFRILMGCSVLNFLYQLDISLVEICFVYTLKLGTRGRLSMSVHRPRLQFVTGLPDSPKRRRRELSLLRARGTRCLTL